MPFQSVPNTAVAEIIVSSSGTTNWGPAQHNMNFEFADPYDQSAINDLANAVAAWWATEMMPTLSADVQLSEVHVRGLNDDIDLEGYANVSIPTAGGIGANVMPANVAACVKFGTGMTGRSARGRMYIAGIAVTGANDDDLTSTVRGNILDAFTALGGYLTPGLDHVVVSRFHDHDQLFPAVTRLVTSYTFSSNQVATQQRRLHRYG